jgi:hypothetical protein
MKSKFEANVDLIQQLLLLTTKVLATKWYAEYLEYHKGIDPGIAYYYICKMSDEKHRDKLLKWLDLDVRKTEAFQIEQAKYLGMTLAQYRGEEPFHVIYAKKQKQ